MMASALLRTEGLQAGYGDLRVLRDATLSVMPGQTVAILGPNGAGKTTLMKVIAGTLRPSAGTIEFAADGRKGSRIDRIGWVPEGRLLFTDFTVYDNLYLSARAAHSLSTFEKSLADVEELFPALTAKLRSKAGDLSGGQQQMVAMGRALVRNPEILLLDEPSMGIAPKLVEEIGVALRSLRQRGLGILIAEQNVSWLANSVDSVAFLSHGRLSELHDKSILNDRQAIRKAYLGG